MHSKRQPPINYKVQKISEIPTDKLSDFYKKTYFQRHKSLTENWRWWYRVGIIDKEPIIITVDEKVIGQAAFLPTKLNILKKIIPAIWFVDYAILPEYMGKGLGQVLYKEWKNVCPNQMAICSDYSLRVLKKFDWKENLETKRIIKTINISKIIPLNQNIRLKFFDNISKYYIKKKYYRLKSIIPHKITNEFNVIKESFLLKKNTINKNYAEILRDNEWLYWRLMECPYKKDIYFFEYKNNFAIVHILLTNNIKKLNILYMYSTEETNFNELTIQILNWSVQNNIDVMWAINRDDNLKDIFPKILNKSVQYAAWSSNQEIFDILSKGLLDLQGIDTDIDSSLYVE